MSRFGLELFNRENPPAGYFSASELWRICGLGPQPAQLTPQVINCNTSFRLFYEKFSSTNKSTWAMLKSEKPKLFPIKFLASSTLKDFQELVASKCNDQFDGAGDLI
ncbi:hypothetical protein PTTG_29925 [Puccinia triticina 1-1 BBBD Race 1]|uniref:Uncharacterized protein n=1 Tax=Puccinia triticina (isolate 1-1 / race 1 (BBBD)) TaxID=630390 RepID=A0A180G183_PUCT1|nr:hypothetical protein PTTG_29925 [Puccinia triticina 1-1 BBBD Race 1]